MSIQRYEMEPDCTLEPMNAEMQRSGIGDWVLYADHLAALAAERERADRAEGALRELGKHPEECADDGGACVSHLAYEDCTAERHALRDQVARLAGAIENLYEVGQQAVDYVGAANYASRQQEAMQWLEEAHSGALEGS